MKSRTFIALSIAIAIGCSKSNDPSANSGTGSASATIGGAAFSATDNKATDTGNGLNIVMASGDQVITMVTDDKKAGTYSIINAAGGRVQAGTNAYATYAKGADVYFSKDGTVTVTVDASGKISVTFSLNLKNASGVALTITNGMISGLSITPAQTPSGKCLISSVVGTETYNGTTDAMTYTLSYDGDGKLLKIVGSEGRLQTFLWANGVVVSHLDWESSMYWERRDFTYSNGKIVKAVRTYADGTQATANYTLNAAGQPASIVITGSDASTNNYTYDANGNCISWVSSSNGSTTTGTYSGYDNKPNQNSLLLSALGWTFTDEGQTGSEFSKNNVGTETYTSSDSYTYTYTYDAKGNVATVKKSFYGGQATTTYNYNCN